LVATANPIIDSGKVKERAIRFLEQHHTVLEIKQTVLKDGIWTVTVLLSSPNDQIRKIRVDAKTGMIIDWST